MASNLPTPNRFGDSPRSDYQDEDASLESELKALWDGEIGTVRKESMFYRKAVVLLLSWDSETDDLHTAQEVDALAQVFEETFNYKTVKQVLIAGERTAQSQINKYLSDFVYEYDDVNTLLIIYYAGHGRKGESEGTMTLVGKNSLVDELSEPHEIIWNSAEHNIKTTKSDVLVIFDCCYAAELEKGVRSGFSRRAYEYLAATSANSTTKKPGKHSFTTALIYTLERLVKTGQSFTTQELLSGIHNAPDFPQDQYPRLSERGPACIRRIALEPLVKDHANQAPDPRPEDDEGFRMDLSLRFVFSQEITPSMVRSLAKELRQLISGDDFKGKTVLWEGIDCLDPVVLPYVHKWKRLTKTGKTSTVERSLVLDTPGTASPDHDQITTPHQEPMTVEPEIGNDEGVSLVKQALGFPDESHLESPLGARPIRRNSPRSKRKGESSSEQTTPQKKLKRGESAAGMTPEF